MKTKTPELVAIEDASLETVAGGWDYPALPSLKLDIEVTKQSNELIFAGNAIATAGDFTFVVDQKNVSR